MANEKINGNITPVDRTDIAITYTSSNQTEYPVVYGDDVWGIVKDNTKLNLLIQRVLGEGATGTYTLNDLLELIARDIQNDKDQCISPEIVSGMTNGVGVKITVLDGDVTKVEVINDMLGAPYDNLDDNTILGLKNAILTLIGDGEDVPTISGLESEIEELKNCICCIRPIPTNKILDMFCN